MALLQNEDFAIWYLRTSYLANVKDGIGERLINVNSAVLNNPGFRAAGWTQNAAESKRAYSPPIPTAFTSENFQGPGSSGVQRITSFGDDEDEGGMVTGRAGTDTRGAGPSGRRRRRKEPIEEDDSSDLSDESGDDTDGAQRAAQQIRFAKMPVRHRADSSPIRSGSGKEGPEVLITSPSRRSVDERVRRGSLGAVEAVKARARRDTTTSSDMSSENEVDATYFQRRQVHARHSAKSNLRDKSALEAPSRQDSRPESLPDDSDEDSVGSALSSELGVTADSASLLNTINENDTDPSSPMLGGMASSPLSLSKPISPKRTRSTPGLPDLPPARPISVAQPISLLGQALRALQAQPRNPMEPFASLSGKGSPSPLWIKIYAPFSETPRRPIDMPLDRFSKNGANVTVAEAIGLSLWRYGEDHLKPEIQPSKLNVNQWILRMVEDGEVDDDFPALTRNRPMSDFTSNNNRGVRARSRERPYDDFALVPATEQESKANEKSTPQYSPAGATVDDHSREPTKVPDDSRAGAPPGLQVSENVAAVARPKVGLGAQPFSTALNNTSLTPADQPVVQTSSATPRIGVTKTLRIRYFDIDVSAQTTTVDIGRDSYIAEVLDLVCKRWHLDKAGFMLRVTGTNTMAPLDRTVEALGTRSDLDLVRRRFGAGPVTLTGSPGSSSPNAPLLLDIEGPKRSRRGPLAPHPLAQKQDLMSSASNFKKFNVTRKQLASFTQGNQRVLAFDGDYLHIMPGDSGRTLFDSGAKSSSIAFSDVLRVKVSTKHPKLVRVFVRRPTETKRYDFEARSAEEAREIVDEVSKEMRLAQG